MAIETATYPDDGENPYGGELKAFIEAAKDEAVAAAQEYADTLRDTLNANNDPETFTNKAIDLGDNTVTGTVAEFNEALSDGDFATKAGTETISNKTFDSTNTFPSGVGVAPGLMMVWPADTPPSGWLLCNGQAVSRATYAALFSAISDSFGTGDGSTTFNVPDLRDSVPVGASGTKPLASSGGADEVTLEVTNLPAHTHGLNNHTHGMAHYHGVQYRKDNVVRTGGTFQRVISVGESTGNNESGKTGNGNKNVTDAASGNTTSTGSGTAFSVQNPYVAMNWVIKY